MIMIVFVPIDRTVYVFVTIMQNTINVPYKHREGSLGVVKLFCLIEDYLLWRNKDKRDP